MNDKIQLKRGTLENWLKADPILMDGEMALVATDASKPNVYDQYKVGGGSMKFSELPYQGLPCLQELGDSTTSPLSQKAITDWINKGYQFRWVATPSTNPGTPDGPVFYIASEPDTYANFGGISVANGEAVILEWNGSWVKKTTRLATEQEIIYDVSARNNGAVFESLSALLSSSNLSTLIPTSVRHGGMTIRFIQGSDQSSDNKYAQYRLMSQTFSKTESDWQGVDDEPTAGSDNLVKSGGVYKERFLDISIYKTCPNNPNTTALAVIDIRISNRQDGYFYWLQLNYDRSSGMQQIGFFRTDLNHISSYTYYVNLFLDTTSGNIQSGVKEYTGILSSGEEMWIKVDWDLIFGHNSFNANLYEFKDWVFGSGRNSQYFDYIPPFDVEGIAKKVQDVGDVRLNLISAKDFHRPNTWSSGTINSIKSTLKGNIVNFTSTGKYAPWQGYITAFIKLKDLEARSGVDFKNTDQYLDIKLKGNFFKNVWVVLRYAEDDSYEFYPNGSVDAVMNKNGSTQGLSEGDSTTWADKVIRDDSLTGIFSVSNFKIPYNYAGKKLYALLLCIGSQGDGTKHFVDVSCVLHGDKNISLPFYYNPIADINEQIIEMDVLPQDVFYAACGDSITNANHTSIENIPESDPYMPIDGYSAVNTYKRKNYAYYLAKRYRIKWANYGWGGTTLSNCISKAYPESQLHPFVNDRIEQLKPGIEWSYISIMFGWNDAAFGPTSQKDKWLYETYGREIGYPVTSAQIGATGFATQEQKDACDAATGTVGDVHYNNSSEYFFARFLGNIDSTDKSTWYGAWNYAVDYLMKKYPSAKIMVVAPFINAHKKAFKQAVHDVAEKYGVVCFDFESLPYWYYAMANNTTPLLNPDDATGYWYTAKGDRCAPNVGGYNQARLSWDTLHPSNLGYKTMAGPIGDKLMNG